MTERENMLRAVRFERPDTIPMAFHINPACWQHYPQDALQELMVLHPLLFPGFERSATPIRPRFGNTARAGERYRDDWGCVWETVEDGIAGIVTEYPLADWSALEGYVAPDPATRTGTGPVDWAHVAEEVLTARADGQMTRGGLPHGHTFMRLSYIRGYENLLCDMASADPKLERLLRMVEEYNGGVVRRYIDLGVDWMSYPEDLGMQLGPMLSPAAFRTYIKPSYERLMAPARDAGCVIHMHSDGDIRSLAADLVDSGVEVVNLQDLVNGIDWIAHRFAGRVCLDLDIDRQQITPFGTPGEIDALIREAVRQLGSREGGLMMIYGLYPGVPLENVKALMDSMERYAGYYR